MLFRSKAELLKKLQERQDLTQKNANAAVIYEIGRKIEDLTEIINIPNNYSNNTSTQKNHFADPNIQVHARVNIQVDYQGNPLLFINEIQSDLAQNIRKESMYLISKKIAEIVLSRKLSDQTANPMNDAEIQIAMNEEAISQWRDDNPKEYADIVEKVKEEYKGYSPIDPNQVTMLALKHAINFAVENGITKIQMNRPQFAGPSVYSLTYRQSKGLEENYTKKIPGLIKKLQNDLKFEISETPNGNIREYNVANIPTDEIGRAHV